ASLETRLEPMMTPPNTPPMSDSGIFYHHPSSSQAGSPVAVTSGGSPRTSRGEGMMAWKKMSRVFGKKKGREVAVEEED
ncbi:hypothetical protein LTS18_012052, partial [Coniosporium uncinatum]